MSLIDLIPGARGIEAIVLCTAIAGIGGTFYAQHRSNVKLRSELVAEKTGRQTDRDIAAATARLAELTNKAQAAQWAASAKDNADEAQRLEVQARDAAAAALRSGVGVRDAFRSAAARGCGAAGAASAAAGSPPDPAAPVVLADVFGRADSLAGELAASLDQSHARGLACERSDALDR